MCIRLLTAFVFEFKSLKVFFSVPMVCQSNQLLPSLALWVLLLLLLFIIIIIIYYYYYYFIWLQFLQIPRQTLADDLQAALDHHAEEVMSVEPGYNSFSLLRYNRWNEVRNENWTLWLRVCHSVFILLVFIFKTLWL